MKIKTIKLKVERENQEFDFSEFFEGSNTIFTTNSQLVEQKDGYYWYAFITYEPRIDKPFLKPLLSPTKELPEGFEEEVRNYLKTNPPKNTRTQNAVKGGLEVVLKCEKMGDFLRLQSVGKGSIKEENVFFEGLLEIVKKYKTNLNTDEDSV